MDLSAGISEAGPVRRRLVVRGAVQGVGFRPFVYRAARRHGLTGWVANSAEGVVIEAQGAAARVAALEQQLRREAPAAAWVEAVESAAIGLGAETGFAIRESHVGGARRARVLPDLATCADCLAELFDPANRRYRYPFINCTQCGPRHSIIEDLPYDRARTTMRRFRMCAACQAEYDDPADRRFHAEPNACPACGPLLALWGPDGGARAEGDAALAGAVAALRAGAIVAAKGAGGFHLLVDAGDEAAVRRLRARKGRAAKPFAVMFPDLAAVRACCRVSEVEAALLDGPARPIVLLRPEGRLERRLEAPSVRMDSPWLGALLPYAPLHHLILRDLDRPLVVTSANVADEPIVTDEATAIGVLGGIADLFLAHDRPIARALDDSVAREVGGRGMVLRGGRGMAPVVVPVAGAGAGLLGVGGHLKNAVALATPGGVVLGPHVGDLDSVAARAAHAGAIGDLARLYETPARQVARDLHPDYAAGRSDCVAGLPGVGVQHHVAHVAACLTEHGLRPPALGVAWDGTGLGPDGAAWGGEFLLLEDGGWRRVAHLRPFRLPGSDAAAREPRRAALGLLFTAFGAAACEWTALAPLRAFAPGELAVLRTMLERGVAAPLTSSVGRLFDAFASLTGLCQRAGYEGQAGAALEGAASGDAPDGGYAFALRPEAGGSGLILDWQPALEACLADLRAGVRTGTISAALHRGLAAAIACVARHVGQRLVVLSGGCFQNALLSEAAIAALRAGGFEPVWHQRIPPNDGGVALGQVAWAAWSDQRGE